MIRVEMLPAERGDALLVEYGRRKKATNYVLIDGGPVNSGLYDAVRERLRKIPVSADGRRHFDLLVITHVDTDHIEGVIRLLQDDELRCVFDDIWYNGWRHLAAVDSAAKVSVLGPKQGEFLGAILHHQGRPWNQYLEGGPVVVPDDGDLPVVTLRGGLTLTLLSPTVAKLESLARTWDKVVRATGFEPGDVDAAYAQFEGLWWAKGPATLGDDERILSSNDNTEANGSSIAFLAELGTRAVLFASDAHDDALTATLRRLRSSRGLTEPLRLDALKLSHHGSKNNTTAQLLREVACDRYLVSTSGHRFDHPDALAIKRVIDHHRETDDLDPPIVMFNYEQPQTTLWKGRPDIDTRYGPDADLTLPTTK
jgi:hypothetical protein